MTTKTIETFARHNHRDCRKQALNDVQRLCGENGARLTPVRQRVLELLWENHLPVSAYDMLDRLRAEGLGSQPPVIYRALDFLIEQGFAHKLPKLNAYVGCVHPGDDHPVQFLICTSCDKVAELQEATVNRALKKAASNNQFILASAVLEIEGTCPSCQTETRS
jgi:Fur family transcriptional regulator, zinc uptake regulator